MTCEPSGFVAAVTEHRDYDKSVFADDRPGSRPVVVSVIRGFEGPLTRGTIRALRRADDLGRAGALSIVIAVRHDPGWQRRVVALRRRYGLESRTHLLDLRELFLRARASCDNQFEGVPDRLIEHADLGPYPVGEGHPGGSGAESSGLESGESPAALRTWSIDESANAAVTERDGVIRSVVVRRLGVTPGRVDIVCDPRGRPAYAVFERHYRAQGLPLNLGLADWPKSEAIGLDEVLSSLPRLGAVLRAVLSYLSDCFGPVQVLIDGPSALQSMVAPAGFDGVLYSVIDGDHRRVNGQLVSPDEGPYAAVLASDDGRVLVTATEDQAQSIRGWLDSRRCCATTVVSVPRPLRDAYNTQAGQFRDERVGEYFVADIGSDDGGGLSDLLMSYQKLVRRTRRHRRVPTLYLVGGDATDTKVDKLLAQGVDRGEVVLVGQIPMSERLELLAGACAEVVVARSRTVPMDVYRALAVGTPVIGYRGEYGLSSVLTRSNSVMVSVGDVNGLARAMRRITGSSRRQRRLAGGASATPVPRPASVAERWLDVFAVSAGRKMMPSEQSLLGEPPCPKRRLRLGRRGSGAGSSSWDRGTEVGAADDAAAVDDGIGLSDADVLAGYDPVLIAQTVTGRVMQQLRGDIEPSAAQPVLTPVVSRISPMVMFDLERELSELVDWLMPRRPASRRACDDGVADEGAQQQHTILGNPLLDALVADIANSAGAGTDHEIPEIARTYARWNRIAVRSNDVMGVPGDGVGAAVVEDLPEVIEAQQLCDWLDGRSVAIVTAGSSLRGGALGEQIDAHEVVVRISDSTGDVADLGTRTDLHVVTTRDRAAWQLGCRVRLCVGESWAEARDAYRQFLIDDRQQAIGNRSLRRLWPPPRSARSVGTHVIDDPTVEAICQRIDQPSIVTAIAMFAVASGARSVSLYCDVSSQSIRAGADAEHSLMDRVFTRVERGGGEPEPDLRVWTRPVEATAGADR